MQTNSPLLAPRVLRGRQEPRLSRTPPEAVGSLGDEALDLSYLANLRLDPWQENALDLILSVDAAGRWVCTEAGVLIARQNGKGNVILPFELAHLFLWPKPNGEPKTIVHTAHELKTSNEAFRKMKRTVTSSAPLMGEIARMPDNNNERGFELANGNRLLFLARSNHSGVGFSVDVLIVDEAQHTPLGAMEALLPAMSAMDNTQVLFTGTVPSEMQDGEYWEGVRDRGRSGSGRRTGWIEFSPTGSEDPDLAAKIEIADETNWEYANPGLGFREGLTRETFEDEVDRIPESVPRQRLSVWPARRAEQAVKLSELDMDVWNRHAREDAAVKGDGVILSLALGRGAGFATIGKAVRIDSDHIAVEHHDTQKGTRWVADDLKVLKHELGNALLVLDPKNAAPVLSSLTAAGINYLAMSMDEIAAAHAQFIEYVNAGLVPHRPQAEVTKSLELATTRPLGRAGVTWEQSDPSKPVSMAQAVTWALWGVLKSEASPIKPTPPPPSAGVLTRDTVAEHEPNLAYVGF